jgi:nucleoside-diphosphate-sugar epimerase
MNKAISETTVLVTGGTGFVGGHALVRGDLDLAVINPTGIFGPVLGPKLSGSVGLVTAMLAGQMPAVPPMHFGVVDVRDVIDLHLRAMTHPAAPKLGLRVGQPGRLLRPRLERPDDDCRQECAESALAARPRPA